jgi:uncharacterized protein YecE (DUF72 family)
VLAPLRQANKLGVVAFQFPPYFVAKPANFDYIASLHERLPGAALAPRRKFPGVPLRAQVTTQIRDNACFTKGPLRNVAKSPAAVLMLSLRALQERLWRADQRQFNRCS